ncbi:MAG: hypothetical protein PF637_00925 [Spirochaetes bacterium]|nr:hypothetical protein [Spirochaetota bacterium]
MELQNERLAVTLSDPGSEYSRSRFDWSGIVTGIVLDGAHNFCSQEAVEGNPGTEGLGLSCEFGINRPVGYDEVGVGEWFPKIGIGFLLRDSDEPYDFFKDYEIDSAMIETLQSDEYGLLFRQEVAPRNGYAWILERAISIKDNRLYVRNSLKNIGNKKIITNEYWVPLIIKFSTRNLRKIPLE